MRHDLPRGTHRCDRTPRATGTRSVSFSPAVVARVPGRPSHWCGPPDPAQQPRQLPAGLGRPSEPMRPAGSDTAWRYRPHRSDTRSNRLGVSPLDLATGAQQPGSTWLHAVYHGVMQTLTHAADRSAPAESLPADSLAAAGELLRALAAPVRIAIVMQLRAGERCVHELVDALGVAQPLISQHLRVLKAARVVKGERRGREVLYRLADDHLAHIVVDAVAHVQEEGR